MKPPKPPVKQTVAFQIDPALLKAVDDLAAQDEETTRSAIIRDALRAYVLNQ